STPRSTNRPGAMTPRIGKRRNAAGRVSTFRTTSSAAYSSTSGRSRGRNQLGELIAAGQIGGALDAAAAHVQEGRTHSVDVDTGEVGPGDAVDRELQRVAAL